MELQWVPLEILLAAVATIVALVAVYVNMNKPKRLPLPPGPKPWPILGNLPHLGELPHRSMTDLAKTYGPLLYLRLGSIPTIVVSSSKLAEEVLRTQDLVFASRPVTAATHILAYKNQNIAFLPYGSDWRYVRKVFTLELFTHKRLQYFQESRREEVWSIVRSVVEKCKGKKPVRMDIIFSQLATNNVCRMLMNKSVLGEKAQAVKGSFDFEEFIKEVFTLFGVFNIGDFIPFLDKFDLQGYKKKMKAAFKKMDLLYEHILDEHRLKIQTQGSSEAHEQDIVELLLTRPNDATGKFLSDDQIKPILMDVILAGTDTSSTTLEWAFSELLRNPDIMEKVRDELDAVVGRDRLVQESDLPKLKYLDCVIKESFRLHPVAPLLVPHESNRNCEVAGYHIPAHCRVFINTWAIGRDPAYWESPLEFRPERFVDSTKDTLGNDFDLLPFGSGRRSCPGRSLGLLLVQYGLAVMVHACDWSLPPGIKPADINMDETNGLTARKAVPCEAIATLRLSSHAIGARDDSVSL